MENNNNRAAENLDNRANRTDRNSEQVGESLRELALTLYQCPGNGGIVTNPRDCFPMNGYSLPNLTIEG